MTQNSKILIVEDQQQLADKLTSYFHEGTDTGITQNLEQTLRKVREWEPDLIIIDVQLKNRNGYELCDALKQDSLASETPVIFFSEIDSLRERMLGYEVGGVDYFHKDTDADEVRAKVQALALQSQKTQELKDNIVNAEKTTMEALATSSELGKAVRYVEQSYDIGDLQSLAELLIQFCLDLDLSAVIMFVVHDGNHFYSTNHNDVSPIEQDLVLKLHSGDRFVDFGCRTLTNYAHVSMLVKNMPIDDRIRYGRIKDSFPFILGATDSKVKIIDAEIALSAHCTILTSSVETAEFTLTNIKSDFQRNLSIVESIMCELSSTMEMDILKMNMDEKDEEHILRLIESTQKKLSIILSENDRTDSTMQDLVDLLAKLSQEQGKIIVDTLAKKHDESTDYQPDIELF